MPPPNMRIRKYAQKYQICCIPSELPLPNNPCPRESSPLTCMCQLYHSPWNVISFTSDERREDDSGGEIANAAHSILLLNRSSWEDDCKLSPPNIDPISGKKSRNEVEEMMHSKSGKEGMNLICCNKTDGKGWKCKKEAKQGHSMCEHHLDQLKSYYIKSKSSNPSSCIPSRGKRSYSKNSKMPSSDFYYYTGFGPLWGKGREIIEINSGDSSSSTPSLLLSHNEEDGDDNGNAKKKKKRARKPGNT
ncbi:uncharacterized protein LOC122057014 [Macadamia integrifolia]|uniref:uncharacterized protein LOC122057014 n=1 Tax=Macadamia integrifolia TaxID=60698 RepID=UPI001C52A2EF|nr:uncharacterized protein LOC122057014 [Macadamia integrifolia]